MRRKYSEYGPAANICDIHIYYGGYVSTIQDFSFKKRSSKNRSHSEKDLIK